MSEITDDEEQGNGTIKKRLKQSVVNGGKKSAKAIGSVYGNFLEFINKGCVVDLAVGIVMGTAFTSIVNSFVKDMMSPFIALSAPQTNLANLFLVIRCPLNSNKNETITCTQSQYATIQIAEQSGALTFNYGLFIQQIINFFVVSVVVYLVVKAYTAAPFVTKVPAVKNCPFCISPIPYKATKCKFCTSEVPLEEVLASPGSFSTFAKTALGKIRTPRMNSSVIT
jgi:large conductance mechanosensitive channel